MGTELLRPVAALAVVFAMLAGLLRKFGKFRTTGIDMPSSAVLRKSQLALTGQHSVHVVSYRDKEWLVATYPGGCTTLAMIDREPEALQ